MCGFLFLFLALGCHEKFLETLRILWTKKMGNLYPREFPIANVPGTLSLWKQSNSFISSAQDKSCFHKTIRINVRISWGLVSTQNKKRRCVRGASRGRMTMTQTWSRGILQRIGKRCPTLKVPSNHLTVPVLVTVLVLIALISWSYI